MRAMIVTIAVFGFALPVAAANRDSDVWTTKARSIIIAHHLLSRADLRCTGLIYDVDSTSKTAGITAVEKHRGRCKGDPDTMPRCSRWRSTRPQVRRNGTAKRKISS